MVHPGLMWGETETAAFEDDAGSEVLPVSEASDLAFVGHDFTFHAFGHSGDSCV